MLCLGVSNTSMLWYEERKKVLERRRVLFVLTAVVAGKGQARRQELFTLVGGNTRLFSAKILACSSKLELLF